MGGTSVGFFESLESRTLFSGGVKVTEPPPEPDLSAITIAHFPKVISPNATVKATLHVSNLGGALKLSSFMNDVYLSDTPDLSGNTTLLASVPIKTALKHGQSKNFSIAIPAPSDIPTDGYYIVVNVNSDGAVVESNIDNNVVASSFLSNPYGHYDGSITLSRNTTVPISFDIAPGDSSIENDGTSLFTSANITDVNATLSSSGHYTLRAKGSIDQSAFGPFAFSFTFSGQLGTDTLSGAVSISVRLDGGTHIGGSFRFSITKTS